MNAIQERRMPVHETGSRVVVADADAVRSWARLALDAGVLALDDYDWLLAALDTGAAFDVRERFENGYYAVSLDGRPVGLWLYVSWLRAAE